jgi:D-sedoheptulose 7-phosphate isomerase
MAGFIASSARSYIDEMTQVLGEVDPAPVDALADCLFQAWRDGRRVFVFGNGGSAYNASHIVTDLVKTAAVNGQRRLAAFSLVDNTGLTTAIGNDLSYDETFSYPLESYSQAGDVAIAISCSGNSPNVLRACRWAREHGLTVAALTGFSGGKVKEMADIHVNVPSTNYGIMEDLHMSVGHIVAQSLKSRITEQAGQPCAS